MSVDSLCEILGEGGARELETVRRVYEAAGRRDAAAVLSLYDPEVELDNTRLDLPDDSGGVYTGHDGLRMCFRGWHQAWENVEYDYDELIDAGDNKAVSVVTRRGRGLLSGADVELRAALVWTLRDGRVALVVWFRSREQALAAAGAE